ncbi:unnamed protein product [Amoebophrya sp. A25]|nr:unnamed protein product [Amoebophrya sp. A25]|eukprot:GSA25T00009297001.1
MLPRPATRIRFTLEDAQEYGRYLQSGGAVSSGGAGAELNPAAGSRGLPGGSFDAGGNNVNVGMGIHRDGGGNDLGGALPPRGSSSIEAGGPPSNVVLATPAPAGNRVPFSPGGS